MKKIDLNEIKIIELNLLKKFDKICRDNNLKYSLAYGTMLGAVRHKGFIPWDDDIDVFMKREDYERLLSLEYADEEVEIKSYRYSPHYYYPFSKMIDKTTMINEPWRLEKNMGVFIDIFPLDYFNIVSKDDKDAILNRVNRYSRDAFLMGHTLKHHRSINIRYFLKFIFLLSTYPFKKLFIKRLDNFCKKNSAGDYCAMLMQANNNPFFPSAYFHDYTLIGFEDVQFPVFSRYDDILTQEYGDYMTLPPIEQQISNHYFTAYRKR